MGRCPWRCRRAPMRWRPRWSRSKRWQSYLLHDAGLPLRESNVAPRFIADELDLNLSAFAAALLVIVVVVVHRARSRPLDPPTFGRVAIANSVLVEIAWRCFVLVGDARHVCLLYRRSGSKRSMLVDVLIERCAGGLYLLWRQREEVPSEVDVLSRKPGWCWCSIKSGVCCRRKDAGEFCCL